MSRSSVTRWFRRPILALSFAAAGVLALSSAIAPAKAQYYPYYGGSPYAAYGGYGGYGGYGYCNPYYYPSGCGYGYAYPAAYAYPYGYGYGYGGYPYYGFGFGFGRGFHHGGFRGGFHHGGFRGGGFHGGGRGGAPRQGGGGAGRGDPARFVLGGPQKGNGFHLSCGGGSALF